MLKLKKLLAVIATVCVAVVIATVCTFADDTTYSITVESVTAGSQSLYTSVSASEATEGTTVTVSTQSYPITSSELHTDGESSGYVVSGLSVVDAEGNIISTSSDSMGSYTFVMPASDVVVTPIVTNYYLSSAEIGIDWDATVSGTLANGTCGYFYSHLTFSWDEVEGAAYYEVYGHPRSMTAKKEYGDSKGNALVYFDTVYTNSDDFSGEFEGSSGGATAFYVIVFAYDESGTLINCSHNVAYYGATNSSETNVVNNGLTSSGNYSYTVSWNRYDSSTDMLYRFGTICHYTPSEAADSYRVLVYSSADGSLYLDTGYTTNLSLTADFVSGDTYYVFIYAFDESGILLDSAGFASFTAGVESANVCGDNLTWSIENGVLTISGTGDMYNYSCDYVAPWYYEKDSITSIVVEDGVTSIGAYAFMMLENVTSVSMPETLTSIGNYVFDGCSGLTSIEIPSGVTSIPNYGFADCTSLETVDLNNVTSLEYGAFNGCESLVNIDLSNITSLEGYEFVGCTSLKEANLISLETGSTLYGTFSGCTSLESVVIPVAVESINQYAFYACTNLTDVYYTGSEDEWNSIYIYEGYSEETSKYILSNATIHYNYVETDDDTSTTYTITITVTENGTVSVDPASAKEGVTVTVTVTANTGYTVTGITVTDASGNTIAVSGSNGIYTFTMPSSAVSITPTFTESSSSGDSSTEHTHTYVFGNWVWSSDLNAAYGVFYCNTCGVVAKIPATVSSSYIYGVLTKTATFYYDGVWYSDSKIDISSLSSTTTTTPTTTTTTTTTEETVTVSDPIEDTNTKTEDEGETVSEPEISTETNPTTGVALSLVPLAIAALAVVSSKRK